MKKDPKYLGIPNINFSLTSKNDNREKIFCKQRIKRGFDDSESWDFGITMANFILPRLKAFKHTYDEDICNKIILALELIVRNNGNHLWTINESEKVTKGLKLLNKHFLTLWN